MLLSACDAAAAAAGVADAKAAAGAAAGLADVALAAAAAAPAMAACSSHRCRNLCADSWSNTQWSTLKTRIDLPASGQLVTCSAVQHRRKAVHSCAGSCTK